MEAWVTNPIRGNPSRYTGWPGSYSRIALPIATAVSTAQVLGVTRVNNRKERYQPIFGALTDQ